MTKAQAIAAYITATYAAWVQQGRPPLYRIATALGATDAELRQARTKAQEPTP